MKDLKCFMLLAKYEGEADIDAVSISGLLKMCGATCVSRTEGRSIYDDKHKKIEANVIGLIGFIPSAKYEKIDKMLSMTDIQYKLDCMDC